MIHEKNHYRFFIEDPIWPRLAGSKEDAVGAMTEAWSHVVERYIRRFPDQWVWMHNRWKTKPEAVALQKERVHS